MKRFEEGDEFYFITADGEWPIYVAETPNQAISSAEMHEQNRPNRRVRIHKITLGSVEPMEIRREVIKKDLVPRGDDNG